MDSPKHRLPVTKTSTSRRHWLLTVPKFWNSLVMDELGCKGFGQVLWERERGQLKSIWKNELLCFSLLNDWRSHIIEWHGFEREDEIISSPHFSSSIYILLKTHLPIHIPNPSLSLSHMHFFNFIVSHWILVLSQVNTIRLPHSFHFLKTLCPWDSFKSSPKQLSHVLLSPAIGFVSSWVNTIPSASFIPLHEIPCSLGLV